MEHPAPTNGLLQAASESKAATSGLDLTRRKRVDESQNAAVLAPHSPGPRNQVNRKVADRQGRRARDRVADGRRNEVHRDLAKVKLPIAGRNAAKADRLRGDPDRREAAVPLARRPGQAQEARPEAQEARLAVHEVQDAARLAAVPRIEDGEIAEKGVSSGCGGFWVLHPA